MPSCPELTESVVRDVISGVLTTDRPLRLNHRQHLKPESGEPKAQRRHAEARARRHGRRGIIAIPHAPTIPPAHRPRRHDHRPDRPGRRLAASAAPQPLKPGTIWQDTAGNRLQAHGAGVFEVGSTYYMVGEDKIRGNLFSDVACYSSTDLAHWTRQNNALGQQSSGDLTADRIVERPKVGSNTFNSQTSFVLPVTGTQGTTYVYIGDRWNSSDLYSSSQVWLPMTISGSTASMNTFYDTWTIDTATGTRANGKANPKWTHS